MKSKRVPGQVAKKHPNLHGSGSTHAMDIYDKALGQKNGNHVTNDPGDGDFGSAQPGRGSHREMR